MKKSLIAAVVAGALLVLLTGCTASAQPDEIAWELTLENPIVAIDDVSGVYVQGRMATFGGGSVDSKGVIDYTYAYRTTDGGIRQGLISNLYEKLGFATEYPGSKVVTIYQDVTKDNGVPRLEIYHCSPKPPSDTDPLGDVLFDIFSLKTCVLPDGSNMGTSTYRVDLHVPAGAVVNTDSLKTKDPNPAG
ncbi:hypothetical protein [Cryobacterium zhongshanensis]|uniref:Lipoprotein n=1 Tax=Cryobacterium zhongshanensis TaxID=2928153 RepID=A0AA41R092_9MICO|nr:hypothetical protein [Cryobacterium zhongshanensis]MCI4659653.1 hypothetical protein [Cryobacterium zhongshanensis]